VNAAEQAPKTKVVKVLLIDENPQRSSYLTERLVKKGCGHEFANSLGEAVSRIRANDYDLVLSATRLRDGGAFLLMDLLEGSNVTLFYFHAVEEGCWWLPGLRRGRKCFGSSAVRPSDFVPMLDEVIDEIQAAQTAEVSLPASRQHAAVSVLPRTSSSRESSPTGIAQPDTVLMKRKAAG
jgi:hypothetical protein